MTEATGRSPSELRPIELAIKDIDFEVAQRKEQIDKLRHEIGVLIGDQCRLKEQLNHEQGLGPGLTPIADLSLET